MSVLREILTLARENPVYVWLAVGAAGVFLLVLTALAATLF